MSPPAPATTAVAAAAAPAPAFALVDRGTRAREAAMFVACGALDAASTVLLLGGARFTPPFEVILGTILHVAAVLLMADLGRTRPGRRWLGVAAVLAVPLVGVAVAAAAWLTEGQGLFVHERPRVRRRRAPTPASLRRLATAPTTYDALECGDEEQRREALCALSRRSDPAAIALLRCVTTVADSDLALSAALVLDEIGERTERELRQRARPEVRRGVI